MVSSDDVVCPQAKENVRKDCSVTTDGDVLTCRMMVQAARHRICGWVCMQVATPCVTGQSSTGFSSGQVRHVPIICRWVRMMLGGQHSVCFSEHAGHIKILQSQDQDLLWPCSASTNHTLSPEQAYPVGVQLYLLCCKAAGPPHNVTGAISCPNTQMASQPQNCRACFPAVGLLAWDNHLLNVSATVIWSAIEIIPEHAVPDCDPVTSGSLPGLLSSAGLHTDGSARSTCHRLPAAGAAA